VVSKPGTPLSSTVGTFGNAWNRYRLHNHLIGAGEERTQPATSGTREYC
jgi:hypothetical protein